jgi:ribonuclease HII
LKYPNFNFERQAKARGIATVCGIDEAGCGPWAGPVVAAAVILDPARTPEDIDDSKKLSEAKREALFAEISACAICGIGIADVERIDRDNILAATLWAMGEAVKQLKTLPHLAFVDGNRAPSLPCPVETIVDGDRLSLSIAAASIMAKVTRDRIMAGLDLELPGYGFASHKGYGTEAHRAALLALGPSIHHRKSFAPVKALLPR